MMKSFQLYKNIILVVASALTLVAVTFAWFSISYDATFSPINAVVAGDAIKVDFFQMNADGDYQPLEGDIVLDEFVPGNSNKYKFEIITKTEDKLKFSFGIDNLPADMSDELMDSVYINYKMYKRNKKTGVDGTVAYVDGELLAHKDGVRLSDITEGTIIRSLSLENHQKTSADRFVIYYEIGLAVDSPSSLSGHRSSLGDIRLNAQRIY